MATGIYIYICSEPACANTTDRDGDGRDGDGDGAIGDVFGQAGLPDYSKPYLAGLQLVPYRNSRRSESG